VQRSLFQAFPTWSAKNVGWFNRAAQLVDRPKDEITIATVAVGGEFEAGAEHQLSGTVEVQAYYLGGFGIGACESWVETRDV
jgi:hypothetical protein